MKPNRLLWEAIEQRRVIRFLYHGKERIVEPHDHGIRNGSVQLLGWQTAGANSRPIPCWLTVKTEEMLELTMLDATFSGGRLTTSGQHLQWDTLFIRVRPPEALSII
jgi:hypothetical protein